MSRNWNHNRENDRSGSSRQIAQVKEKYEIVMSGKEFNNFKPDMLKNKKINLGLYLNKYSIRFGDDKKFDLKEQINKILDNQNKLRLPASIFDLDSYSSYYNRFLRFCESLKSQGYHVEGIEPGISWRLLIGLGGESVYETSITLHRNYSVPIIPGSAVKGITRAYAKKEKLNKEIEIEIFGNDENKNLSQGKVVFFDAFPVIEKNNKEFLVLDIMNVHYKEYYEGKYQQPGDWMNPVPINFLATEGLRYRFMIASKDEKLAKESIKLLKGALKYGIGAKTSSGYGYFDIA